MARRRLPELELSVEEITPEIAAKWLEFNVHNRKLRQRIIDTYAEAMRNGEWVLNGEPIIFDKKGRLQSGQHRLYAVIQSGVSIWSVVVRGAEPHAIFSLDSGRKRTIADALTLRGEVDTINLGTAVSWRWRWTNKLMDVPGVTATNTHLLRVFDQTPGLKDSIAVARTIKHLGISVGLAAALHYGLAEIDEEDADAFFKQLALGTDLREGEPIYALRQRLVRLQSETGRPSGTYLAGIVVKAWNAYREHRPMQAVRYAGNEAFPEAV